MLVVVLVLVAASLRDLDDADGRTQPRRAHRRIVTAVECGAWHAVLALAAWLVLAARAYAGDNGEGLWRRDRRPDHHLLLARRGRLLRGLRDRRPPGSRARWTSARRSEGRKLRSASAGRPVARTYLSRGRVALRVGPAPRPPAGARLCERSGMPGWTGDLRAPRRRRGAHHRPPGAPQRRRRPTAELLGEAYERFEADDDARVLVLTGAGGVAFCAGADLKAIETFGPRMARPARAARLHAA